MDYQVFGVILRMCKQSIPGLPSFSKGGLGLRLDVDVQDSRQECAGGG